MIESHTEETLASDGTSETEEIDAQFLKINPDIKNFSNNDNNSYQKVTAVVVDDEFVISIQYFDDVECFKFTLYSNGYYTVNIEAAAVKFDKIPLEHTQLYECKNKKTYHGHRVTVSSAPISIYTYFQIYSYGNLILQVHEIYFDFYEFLILIGLPSWLSDRTEKNMIKPLLALKNVENIYDYFVFTYKLQALDEGNAEKALDFIVLNEYGCENKKDIEIDGFYSIKLERPWQHLLEALSGFNL